MNKKNQPKGCVRSMAQIQSDLLQLFDYNLKNLQNDIDTLPAKDRAAILVSLSKHITAQALNPETLTQSQLQQVVDYLKTQQ